MAAAFTQMKADIIWCCCVVATIATLYLNIFCRVCLTGYTNLCAERSAPLPPWKSTEELIDTSAIDLEHTQGMGNCGYGDQIMGYYVKWARWCG